MTEQGAGFRFDIYERVLIPDDTPAIASLEQVELKPEVRSIPGREHSQLQGCLELTAVYETDQEKVGKQTFLHRIPVEISLPVRGTEGAVDNIQVTIEEFDVELISKRSMNVTGVLSLKGWKHSASNTREDGKEMVAVHEATGANQSPAKESRRSPQPANENRLREEQGTGGGRTLEAQGREVRDREARDGMEPERGGSDRDGQNRETDERVEQSRTEQAEETDTVAAVFPEAQQEEELQENLEFDQHEGETSQFGNDVSTEAESKTEFEADATAEADSDRESPPDRQGLKLAFNSAKPTESDQFPGQTGQYAQPESNNALQWKSLFLSKDEQTKFRSMRMCIVQKEETIQTIAERYQLHPREIELYNRLGDDTVSEGQILYIPTK